MSTKNRGRSNAGDAPGKQFGRSLRMEQLEDRRLLATYVVNNPGDLDGNGNVIVGTLRQAVNLSNSTPDITDTILFEDYLFDGGSLTISLDGRANGGTLNITDQVSILGPGSGVLTVSGSVGQRVFNINIDGDNQFRSVTLGGMTISGGSIFEGDGRGGGIFNQEALTLIETVVTGNSAFDGGGGIYQPFGAILLQNSLVSNNDSGGGGGGIFNGSEDGTLDSRITISNSTLSGNSTFSIMDHPGFGGGVFNRRGTVNIEHSTISENTATVQGGGVATYGVGDPAMDAPIITNLNYTIAHGNTVQGNPNDVAGIYFDTADMPMPLVPTLNILNYNIIGNLGGGSAGALGSNGHFYLVISAPEGIDWDSANLAASFGTSHLATLTSVQENDDVFLLIDDPLYWKGFEPEDDDDMRPAQNIGPWIGGIQLNEGDGPGEGWEWVAPDNMVPFVGIWDAGQPDDGAATSSEDPPELAENRLAFHSMDNTMRTATWGDFENDPADEFKPIAYVIEFDSGTNMFGVDPVLRPLDNYGGSTPVYYPNTIIDEDFTEISPAIDAGDPEFLAAGSEQRGRHFRRVADGLLTGTPVVDIGAVEVQQGLFVVDALEDENDGQYSRVWDTFPTPDQAVLPNGTNVIVYDYTTPGDFSLREALDFSRKNPELDTITFSPFDLVDPSLNTDPTPSPSPTILLQLGQLSFDHSVIVVGPQEFVLEIDANDPTPAFKNNDGHRVAFVSPGTEVSISNLTFLGGDQLGNGGAIQNFGDLTLNRMTLKGSGSSLDGGGLFQSFGSLMIDSSTISGNTAADDGAGLYINFDSGPVTITNSTISGNSAGDRGAGIFNRGYDTLVEHSTITNNQSASTRGSGVWNHPTALGTVSVPQVSSRIELYSTIVSGNFIFDVEGLVNANNNAVNDIISGGFNLIGNGNASSRFMAINGDLVGITNPKLEPLTFGGGLTQVHVLMDTSPALNAGDPAFVGPPDSDQRGTPYERVIDGRIDIGSYELQGNTYIVDTTDDFDDGNYGVGFLGLREAINLSNFSPRPDFIEFDPMLLGSQIFVNPLSITDHLTISGLGAPALFLTSGDPINQTAFEIDDADPLTDLAVAISGMSLLGATIVSREDLSLTDLVFSGASFSAINQAGGSLTIADSTMTGNSAFTAGGAINAQNTDVSISYTTISGNSTNFNLAHGGGLFLSNSSLTTSYAVITNNLVSGGASDGGGIFIDNSGLSLADPRNQVTLTNSVVSGNITSGSNSEGGGIFAKNANLLLEGKYGDFSVLTNNRTIGTSSEGGALYLNGGTLTMVNAFITQNRTQGNSSHGGSLAINGGTVTITDSTLQGNFTSGNGAHGGAIHTINGNLTVNSSTLSGNSTTGIGSKGGAVFTNTNLATDSTGQRTTFLNSTISGNSTQDHGGGIYNADGVTSIAHSTITNNSAPLFGRGSGIASFGNSATTRTDVYSTIIAGNGDSDVDRVNGSFQDTFKSLGYNLIGFGITDAFAAPVDTTSLANVSDPLLSPLQSNGGPTLTHLPVDGSPAVNRGNPADMAGVGNVPIFDQRGLPRVQAGRIDIGSVESALLPLSVGLQGDFDDDGDVDGRDFLAWLRGFGKSGAAKFEGDADGNGIVNGSDLVIWQDEYGSQSALVASLQVEQQEPESTLVSSAISNEPVSLAPITAPAAEGSDSTFTTSRSLQIGWGVPALFASQPEVDASVASEAKILEAALSDAVYSGYLAPYGTEGQSKLDDFAPLGGEESDAEDFEAADEVFGLIGSGAF
ncbi:choice-of-anchor Q domain-containing protein [Bythopirellula polymerisocia]|nr:choice-of-anchor Q domain-containing protein [Bythopirellula polymerisocia]